MKDLGLLSYFLRVNVIQSKSGILINQSAYFNTVLKKFDFDQSNPVSTPADVGTYPEKSYR